MPSCLPELQLHLISRATNQIQKPNSFTDSTKKSPTVSNGNNLHEKQVLCTHVKAVTLSENSPHHNPGIYEITILPAGKYSS